MEPPKQTTLFDLPAFNPDDDQPNPSEQQDVAPASSASSLVPPKPVGFCGFAFDSVLSSTQLPTVGALNFDMFIG